MNLLLDNPADLIRTGIEANRNEAANLMPDVRAGDCEAGKRLNQLNDAWSDLEESLALVTGVPFAPYRMGT